MIQFFEENSSFCIILLINQLFSSNHCSSSEEYTVLDAAEFGIPNRRFEPQATSIVMQPLLDLVPIGTQLALHCKPNEKKE